MFDEERPPCGREDDCNEALAAPLLRKRGGGRSQCLIAVILLSSFWEEFTRLQFYSEPLATSIQQYFPSDKELFVFESEYIRRITEESPAVVLGRCGRFVLKDFPRRASIFVMADLPERVQRVSKLYNLDADAAKARIASNDKDRSAFNRAFTKNDFTDLRLYDLCINTSSVGLDQAVRVASAAIRAKLEL